MDFRNTRFIDTLEKRDYLYISYIYNGRKIKITLISLSLRAKFLFSHLAEH